VPQRPELAFPEPPGSLLRKQPILHSGNRALIWIATSMPVIPAIMTSEMTPPWLTAPISRHTHVPTTEAPSSACHVVRGRHARLLAEETMQGTATQGGDASELCDGVLLPVVFVQVREDARTRPIRSSVASGMASAEADLRGPAFESLARNSSNWSNAGNRSSAVCCNMPQMMVRALALTMSENSIARLELSRRICIGRSSRCFAEPEHEGLVRCSSAAVLSRIPGVWNLWTDQNEVAIIIRRDIVSDKALSAAVQSQGEFVLAVVMPLEWDGG